MNELRVLELAAKAAGFSFSVEEQRSDYGRDDWGERVPHANGEPWNPLKSDGDAFRLLVRLGLDLRRLNLPHAVYIQAVSLAGSEMETISDVRLSTSPDSFAATRRAIVRAAAQMAGHDT